MLVLALALSGCGIHRHYNDYRPPVDAVSAELAPGVFGWIAADRREPDGRWSRDVTLIVQVLGPVKLNGAGCVVSLSGQRTVTFKPHPSHTWTVYFRAAEGDHLITVDVGYVHRELPLHVWVRQ